MRNFDSLSEREILALAISLEEEDERVYSEYAEGLRANFPASAEFFDGMGRVSLTGRGYPWARGIVCELMTALGGIGHTPPFLIPGFRLAMIVAGAV